MAKPPRPCSRVKRQVCGSAVSGGEAAWVLRTGNGLGKKFGPYLFNKGLIAGLTKGNQWLSQY